MNYRATEFSSICVMFWEKVGGFTTRQRVEAIRGWPEVLKIERLSQRCLRSVSSRTYWMKVRAGVNPEVIVSRLLDFKEDIEQAYVHRRMGELRLTGAEKNISGEVTA